MTSVNKPSWLQDAVTFSRKAIQIINVFQNLPTEQAIGRAIASWKNTVFD
jgi:hypothetical protein